MEIQEDKRGDITVLSLAGRLDTNTSGSLEQKLIEALDDGVTKFIVDFTQLDYISSIGLRVLLMAAKKLKELNGVLVLSSLSAHVREVFDIAGFTPIFTLASSLDEAVAGIA